jgi:hypothetical protein
MSATDADGVRDQLDECYAPVRGDVIGARDQIAVIEVMRVSRRAEWADIRVTQLGGAEWTKRQPLPWRLGGALLTRGWF